MASSLNDIEHALRGLSPEAEKRFVTIRSDSGCMTPLPSTDGVLSEASPLQASKGLPKEPTKKTKKRKSADAEINSPRLRDLEEENAALKAKVEAFKSIVEKVNEDRATMKKELDKHKKHKAFDTETKKLKEELAALQTRLEAKEAEAFHLDESWKKESRESKQKEQELTLKIEILEKTLAELRVKISNIYSDNYNWRIQTETEKVDSQKTIAALKEELEKYRANMSLLGQSPSLSARQVKKSDHGEPQRDTKALIEGHRCVMLNDHFVMKEQVIVDLLRRFEHLAILSLFDGLKFLVHIRLLQKKLERDLESEFSCYCFVDVSATLSGPKRLNSTETHELLQAFKPLCLEISQALSEGKRIFEPLTVMYDNMIPTVCGYLLDMPWIYCTKTQNNCLSNCLLRKIDIFDSENGNFICGYTVPEELFDQDHHDKHLNRLKALLNVSGFKETIQMISRPILLL